MQILRSILLCFLFLSCTEKWSEEQTSGLALLASQLTEKVNLHSELQKYRFEQAIKEAGNREWDIKIKGELNRITEAVLIQGDTFDIDNVDILNKRRADELSRKFGRTSEVPPSFAELDQALLLNSILEYYGWMMGSNDYFHTPYVWLCQSVTDPNTYRTGVGSKFTTRNIMSLKADDSTVQILSPMLISKRLPIAWRLVFIEEITRKDE